jgi:hypothetical protein
VHNTQTLKYFFYQKTTSLHKTASLVKKQKKALIAIKTPNVDFFLNSHLLNPGKKSVKT